MSFKEIIINKEYRSLNDNVVTDFYIPVLQQAKEYKRAVGYFSSSALIQISKGISGLIKNGGKIKLIASPNLPEEDLEAINKGYKDRKTIIIDALLNELKNHDEYHDSERLNLLANLIASGSLDIKIAITSKLQNLGLYHEKMGIITDFENNRIAFSGSMNETEAALTLNYEAIDVFCDWKNDDELMRVESKTNAFERIWSNTEDNIEVLDFPEIKDAIIKKYKKNDKPFVEIDIQEYKKIIERKKQNGPRMPELSDSFSGLHDYQEIAIDNWEKNGFRGIFDMATGTGKTFTGLGAIVRLDSYLNDKLATIIVCPYQHLVEQWVEDIVRFNIEPIIAYSTSSQKDWKNRLDKAIRDQKIRSDKRFFCLVTTNATFSSDYVQKSINKIQSQILLIADEAHNFGAENLRVLMDERFDYRLALSATLDRHHDPEGTQALYDFFGEPCIHYSLDRAIKEDKLTPYKYHMVCVYLNDEELENYESLSYQMSKQLTKTKTGATTLNAHGKMLAIKRSRVVAAASMKLLKLKEVIYHYKDNHFILVYCGATNVVNPNMDVSETDDDDMKQIEAVTRLLGNSIGMKVAKFTSEENIEKRSMIKEHFKDGDDLQAIVAIKCLDEGVNIPGIRTAFILASTTNPKEYIQRRGRVLRKAKGKEYAEIYDFITLPRPLDEVPSLTAEQLKRDVGLVKNEIKRALEFANLSLNAMENMKLIWEICDVYHLNYNNIDEEDEYYAK